MVLASLCWRTRPFLHVLEYCGYTQKFTFFALFLLCYPHQFFSTHQRLWINELIQKRCSTSLIRGGKPPKIFFPISEMAGSSHPGHPPWNLSLLHVVLLCSGWHSWPSVPLSVDMWPRSDHSGYPNLLATVTAQWWVCHQPGLCTKFPFPSGSEI